ncbi:hypothetical protein M9H77_11339 [Catharanthus roseus]|uniref:Uncharacterized protein n=1 Tax=Catharanthus roseus TaxID=4058 RepID=A0ACC0BEB7_CATRO|nr:hypothetical protein M9H77_11339 [Catharanthus roseus]
MLKYVTGQVPNAPGAWCIPKPSSTEVELLENIQYACGIVDCSLIQTGGPCFEMVEIHGTVTSLNLASLLSLTQRVWCIPKPSSTEIALKENVMYACGMVDCSLIQRGGSCFEPNTSMNHASVVMNLYYQQSGRNPWNCDFKGSGIIAIKNPSKQFINYY